VTRLAWLLAVLPLAAGAQSELKASTEPRGVNPMQTGAKCDGREPVKAGPELRAGVSEIRA